jgi:hypothetical protein
MRKEQIKHNKKRRKNYCNGFSTKNLIKTDTKIQIMALKTRDGWPIRSDRDFDRIGYGS